MPYTVEGKLVVAISSSKSNNAREEIATTSLPSTVYGMAFPQRWSG